MYLSMWIYCFSLGEGDTRNPEEAEAESLDRLVRVGVVIAVPFSQQTVICYSTSPPPRTLALNSSSFLTSWVPLTVSQPICASFPYSS